MGYIGTMGDGNDVTVMHFQNRIICYVLDTAVRFVYLRDVGYLCFHNDWRPQVLNMQDGCLWMVLGIYWGYWLNLVPCIPTQKTVPSESRE